MINNVIKKESGVLIRTYTAVLLMVISFSSYSIEKIHGVYSYEYTGEKLNDGTTAFIYWAFNFIDNRTVNLSITSWHAPFRCDGNYDVQYNKNEIDLIYNKNNEYKCDENPPQFTIKEANGQYFVKSPLFYNDIWHPLEKLPKH